MQSTANYDRLAAAFSLSCVAHCLLLPVVAISLPFVAAAAEAEWIHWLLTVLAIAASAIVILTGKKARVASFLIPAGFGIFFIALALFAESMGFEETLPTVIGGFLLAAAHLYRLATRQEAASI